MGINIGKISNKVASVQAIGDKLGLFKKKDKEKRELEQDPRVTIEKKKLEEALSDYQFPRDIGNKYFMMQFKAFDYANAISGGDVNETTKDYIVLPIPKELTEKYSVNYQNEQLGLTGAGLDLLSSPDPEADFQKFQSDVTEDFTAFTDAFGVNAPKGASVLAGVKAIKETGTGKAVGSGLAALGLNSLQGAAELYTGAAANPVERALFRGVPLRDFNFTWKLVPRNAGEVESIRKIINVIRKKMHPARNSRGLDQLTLDYPDVVDFEFKGTMLNVPYQTSFVTSLNVDYAPDGASFFIKDGYPTAYAISIGFKEIRPVDKSQFDDTDAAVTE